MCSAEGSDFMYTSEADLTTSTLYYIYYIYGGLIEIVIIVADVSFSLH